MNEWLTEESVRKEIPFEDLFTIGRELDQNVVAIRIGDVFPITYSLVAQVKTSFIKNYSI